MLVITVITCHMLIIQQTDTLTQDYFMQSSSSEAVSTKRKPKFIRKSPNTVDVNAHAVQQEQQSQLGAVTDKQTLRTFLSGSQCLTGVGLQIPQS